MHVHGGYPPGPKGRKPTAPVAEKREREEPKGQPAPELESAPQGSAAEESLGEQFLRGAVLGDYGGEATVASVAGQVLVGFTPVGILADVRDFSAALKNLNEGKPGAGVGVVLAGIGFLPFGDIAKVLRKGDDLVEAGTDAARLADDVPSGPTSSGRGSATGRPSGADRRVSPSRTGEFSVSDWKGYPAGLAKPTGPFKLLDGAAYEAARKAANKANAALRRGDPATYAGKQIHEIHPVKFGGSPTDPANKIALTPAEHAKYTTFWNRLMRELQ